MVGHLTNYLLLHFTIASNITQGTLYRLRYRSLNAIGWSEYSPIAYVLAANVPVAPLQPMFVSSTQTTVTLSLPRSQDNQGSPITGYKLWVDAGDDFTSSFREVTSYNGWDVEFTTDAVIDLLVTGKTYRFKTQASNAFGDSEYSYEVIVGVGAQAPAPGEVTRDAEFQSENSILVHWPAVELSDLPITGYVLEMDDGLGGPFVEIYDGRENT